jgi:hypothetical protein
MRKIILFIASCFLILLSFGQRYSHVSSGVENGVKWTIRWYEETTTDYPYCEVYLENNTGKNKKVTYYDAYIQTGTRALISRGTKSTFYLDAYKSRTSGRYPTPRDYGAVTFVIEQLTVLDN